MAQLLTDAERTALVGPLLAAGWARDPDRDALTKEFAFAGFAAAFGWMTQVALHAERHDHHPEWTNVYRRVTVTLTTHSAGGLTQLDIDLARRMDALA